MWNSWSFDDGLEEKLAKKNHGIKTQNVDKKNWLFGDRLVAIENARDHNNRRNDRNKLREKIIWIFTINEAIVKPTEQNWRQRDLDVFPGAFINCSKKSDKLVVVCNVIKKVGKRADEGDDDAGNDEFYHY